MIRLRLVGVAAAALAGAALGVPAVLGAGAGTVSFTQTIKNQVVDSEPDSNPCSGAPGTFTLFAESAVFHVTFNSKGFWATFTATGTATFIPNDSSQPSYSGHFAVWDGENGNLRNGTETAIFSARLTGTDGSLVTNHEVAHISFSASGVGPISFDRARLTCG